MHRGVPTAGGDVTTDTARIPSGADVDAVTTGPRLMTSDPNGPWLEWSRDGVAYFCLLVLVLAFVLWIGILVHS